MNEFQARNLLRDIGQSIIERAEDPEADARTIAYSVEQQARLVLAELAEQATDQSRMEHGAA